MRVGGAVWVAVSCVMLQGCSEPMFEFRGYTDLSDCRHVIDAELALGANFEDAYDSLDRREPEFITRLTGKVYDEDVFIEIACTDRGRVNRIFYVLDSQDPQTTGSAFIRYATALEMLFGVPEITIVEGSRTLNFICAEASPVVLEEYVVTVGEDDEESEHELYLGIVPSAASCAAGGGE